MENRKAEIQMHGKTAGWLTEDEEGYHFVYDAGYLAAATEPVSLTFPLQESVFTSKVLFPFFDGLIPEGWMLGIVEKNWKIDARDRMGLLLVCCKDCIGAASVLNVGNGGQG